MSFHISQRFIDELLEEDCPYMDLTVEALGIGREPGLLTCHPKAACVVAGVEVADLAAEVVERMDGHGTFQSIGMDASIVPLRAGGRRWGEWRWGGRSAHGGAVPPTRCDGRPPACAICFQRVSQADGVPAPAPASGTMFRRARPLVRRAA